jgi:DNA-directed RNA polymerase specialized sigma24 family protein
MPDVEEKQFKEIISKMDLIIRLLALNIVKGLPVQKDKIITLSSFGFGPSEIAKLLGTTSNTVNVALSEMRKMAKKKKQTAETSQIESDSVQDSGEVETGEKVA